MKRSVIAALAVLAATACLTACSAHTPRGLLMSEAFIATITANGLKQFTYTVSMNMDPRGKGGGMGGGGMGGGGMGGGDTDRRRGSAGDMQSLRRNMETRVETAVTGRLTDILAETGYCPHGWFIIRENFHSGFGEVLGECKASDRVSDKTSDKAGAG